MRRQDLRVGEVYALGGQRNIHYAGILLDTKAWTPMGQRYQGHAADPVIARHRSGGRTDKGSLFVVMRQAAASTEVELLRRWFADSSNFLDTLDERTELRRSDNPGNPLRVEQRVSDNPGNPLHLYVEESINIRRTWADQLVLWEEQRQDRLELARKRDEDYASKEALAASIELRARTLAEEVAEIAELIPKWGGTRDSVSIKLTDLDRLLEIVEMNWDDT